MSRKLSVLFVVRQFPALSERFILDQAVDLIENGCEVTIFAPFGRRRRDPSNHPDVERWALSERVHTPVPEPVGRLSLAGAAALEALRRPRAALQAWRTAGSRGWRSTPVFLLFRRWLVEQPHFDVMHCQFGHLGLLGQLARETGAHRGGLVVSFRGWDASELVQRHGPELYTSLFASVDFCLPNCEFFRRRLIELGCPAEKIQVQRSGIRVASFPERAVRPPDPERLSLLTVGRAVEKKGIEIALRSVALLATRFRELRYRIVGGGPLEQQLAATARSLGLESCVELLGPKNQEQILSLLREADFLLAPSVTTERGDQDAPLNVLKEAMAVGVPVIATRHGGIPELVHNGETGFLVAERDPEALAETIGWLLRHPELLPPVVRAARLAVERHWDAALLGRGLRRLYNETSRACANRE